MTYNLLNFDNLLIEIAIETGTNISSKRILSIFVCGLNTVYYEI